MKIVVCIKQVPAKDAPLAITEGKLDPRNRHRI